MAVSRVALRQRLQFEFPPTTRWDGLQTTDSSVRLNQ